MKRYKDKDGETNVCARCGIKGLTTGILCYVRRTIIVVPRFQFEPEARYITDRTRLEQDLAGVDFEEGFICRPCYDPPEEVIRGEKLDG